MRPSNSEQKAFNKAISELSAKLNKNLSETEEIERFFSTKWQLLSAIDLPGIVTDPDFGGSGLDIATVMNILESLGYYSEDAGLSFSLCTHLISTQIPIGRYGTMQCKQKFLPGLASGSLIGAHAITESHAGSDVFSMNSTAEKSGGHYVLNGAKTYISNGPIADVFIVYAWTDLSRGIFGGLSAFIVEKGTPGFSRGKSIKTMGLQSSPLCELFFDNCKLQETNLLNKEGKGYAILNYVMNWEMLCCAALHLGEAKRLIKKCINYSKNRRQYGRTLSKYQAISHKIVDMQIRLKAATAAAYDAAHKFTQGHRFHIDIAAAKVLASENYVQTSLDAVQIFGAYGYTKESGIECSVRDSIASKIYSGSSEIQRNKIAALLGL